MLYEKICSGEPNKVKISEILLIVKESLFNPEEWNAQQLNTHYFNVHLRTRSRKKETNIEKYKSIAGKKNIAWVIHTPRIFNNWIITETALLLFCLYLDFWIS